MRRLSTLVPIITMVVVLWLAASPELDSRSARAVQLSNHPFALSKSPNGFLGEPNTFDCTAVSEIPLAECEALVTLYETTNGPNWITNTDWLITNTPCDWHGVACRAGNVTALALPRNQLDGAIPASLGQLARLERLSLQENQLRGPIPPELVALANLQELTLSFNQLTGTIPAQIGNLLNLERLYLHANQLSGSIPPTAGNLVKLQKLYLRSNHLSGNIPAELGNLANLAELSLAFNDLNGSIPVELGNLAQLQLLYLQSNQLNGSIPVEFGNLVDLQKLYLDTNQLSGSIPASLGNLENLLELGLSANQLTGDIPASLGNLTNLQRLYLQSNQLSGSIPASIGNLANLEKLYLSFNQLDGQIPAQVGNLDKLQDLFLAHNQLIGELPSTLGNLTSVLTLTVGANSLSGALPSTLVNLQNIQSLRFRDTNLCEPMDAQFQTWLAGIADVASSDLSCAPEQGDTYEHDNECIQASAIPTDSLVQQHNFHINNDIDWVRFDAEEGTRYLVKFDPPADSTADGVIEVYSACDGMLGNYPDQNFAPGVHIEFTAPQTGPMFLKLFNFTPDTAGANARYELSVRSLSPTPTPGALILVAGSLFANDHLQPNIYYVTDAVRQLFIDHGYTDERIQYLASDANHAHVDALATVANLQNAITTWALDKVGGKRPLTLYLMDHGAKELVYLDKQRGEWVTPAQIDAWLSQVEAAHPGLIVNVIVEACYAGTFISMPQTVSKPGRVVVTSTDDRNVAYASQKGAHFSDHFINALGNKSTLYGSFLRAKQTAATVSHQIQAAWLDGDGDGIHNEPIDFSIAAQRGFEIPGTLPGSEWPPYIVQAEAPSTIENGQGLLRAVVRDDVRVDHVWAVIYPPGYTAPVESEALVRVEDDEALATIVLRDTDGDGQYSASYTGFDAHGTYRIVIYAEDDLGLGAQPVALEVSTTGNWLFLPVVIR